RGVARLVQQDDAARRDRRAQPLGEHLGSYLLPIGYLTCPLHATHAEAVDVPSALHVVIPIRRPDPVVGPQSQCLFTLEQFAAAFGVTQPHQRLVRVGVVGNLVPCVGECVYQVGMGLCCLSHGEVCCMGAV